MPEPLKPGETENFKIRYSKAYQEKLNPTPTKTPNSKIKLVHVSLRGTVKNLYGEHKVLTEEERLRRKEGIFSKCANCGVTYLLVWGQARVGQPMGYYCRECITVCMWCKHYGLDEKKYRDAQFAQDGECAACGKPEIRSRGIREPRSPVVIVDDVYTIVCTDCKRIYETVDRLGFAVIRKIVDIMSGKKVGSDDNA